MSTSGTVGPVYRVVLLRHGETHGYLGDLGLTERGEAQARERARLLAKELTAAPAGTRVRFPHAPTARGTATAETLRATLVETLSADHGHAHGLELGELEPDAHFDSLQFFHDGVARESSGVAKDRRALDPGSGADPDWALEFDRFDSDYGELSKTGGPIDRWLTSTTLRFEPPQIAVYRLWAGVTALAARDEIALVSTHSGPMRAFVAAAIGRDPGEPENLEPVEVTLDGRLAEIVFREHRVVVEVPDRLPPWIAPGYVAGDRG